jgi:hypothetical protein
LIIATTNSKEILADAKVWTDPLRSIVENLDQWSFYKFEELNCRNIVYLQEWDYIAPVIRYDTNVSNTLLNNYPHIPNSRSWNVLLFRSSLGSWTYDSGNPFPHSWSWTQFTIRFLSKWRWDAPYIYT